MNEPAACIALLTDFGAGEYAGIMKGVLAGLAPESRTIDLCHDLPAWSVLSAAYVLYSAWHYFPPGTVFCAVVDPGVGGRRGLLLAESRGRLLVAPDNGIVSLLARFEADLRCWRLRGPEGRGRRQASATFHGRDILAPAAALAAAGGSDRLRGDLIAPRLDPRARPELSARGGRGRILHIDRFGNCVSALHAGDLEALGEASRLRITAGGFAQTGLKSHYAQVPRGRALAYPGSAGFLEIGVREGHAASRLGLKLLDEVCVTAAGKEPWS